MSQRENLSDITPPLFDPVDMNFISESISLSACGTLQWFRFIFTNFNNWIGNKNSLFPGISNYFCNSTTCRNWEMIFIKAQKSKQKNL